MKRLLIIISGLALLVALYYGTSTAPEIIPLKQVELVKAPETEAIEKEEKEIQSHLVAETQIKETSNVDPDRDYLLWSKATDELESIWDQEIYTHIQYIDRERANELYRIYLQERKQYLKSQDRTLAASLNELSRLNGESIPDEDAYSSPEMRHDEFITTLRKHFRQHYGYIEDQRKIFLDTHSLP